MPKNATGGGSQDNPAQADDTDSRLGTFDAMDSVVTRAAAAPALPSISVSSTFSGSQDLTSSTNPESAVAVTSGGITFNLLFDAVAPASFRAIIQQAAAMLASVLSDQITVNLNIHYSGTGGGASAKPDNGLFESYSSTIAALVNHASLGDTTLSMLPGGSSIQGQSQVAVWNAQLKALGFLGATAGTDDGEATFATDINPNLLFGVALHELTHALGRVPYGSQPDIFDLFRFTAPGVRLFQGSATAPAAYFSLDGGFTKLADYGQTSDSSDFLNSGVQGPNDPFDEFYTGNTNQGVTTIDLLQLDALGFHLTSNTPITIEANGSTSLMVAGNHAYYLVPVGGTSGPQLRYGGAAVIAGEFGPSWAAIGAEHNTSGGYQVVWTMPSTNQYTVWTTDSSGNYLSQTPVVSAASWYVQSLEPSFNQDLNSDGRIGPVTTTVEASGSTTLAKVADSYFLYPVGGSSGPQLFFSGAYTAAGQFGAWTPIGAEHNASGGYAVVWKNGGADQFTVWTTDSSGHYTSQTPTVTSASWYVQSLEQSFNQDLNGDGRIGPVTTTVEASGSTTLAKVADSYFLYPVGGSSGPQLFFSGAYTAAGQFGAWTPLGAEHNATGGYAVVWKNGGADQYTVWTTDSSGNYLSQTPVVSAASWYVQSLEASFNQDLNGDGRIGPVTTTVEASGSTTLAKVADSYFLYPVGGSSGPQLRWFGAYTMAGQFGAWTPIGAEQTVGGYEIAWKNGAADQYTVWSTDSSGNYLSQSAVVSGNSSALQSFEASFHQDLNHDGTILPTTVIEAFGSTTLAKAGNSYLLNSAGGLSGPLLSYGGAYVVAGQFGSWVAIGAEQMAGGYEVAWKNGGADQYTVWTTDSSGNYLSQTAVLSGASLALQSLETSFNQDLNGDGVVGPVTTVIEASGSTRLAQVANTYSLYPLVGSSGPQLRYGGPAVTLGQFGAWAAIGAEHNASGGYTVVWKNGGADQYTVWTTDSSGNYLSQTAVSSGASLALQSLETSFNQDLNGDGVVGPLTTVIEASGSTRLAQVANTYSLYPLVGSSGPQLRYGGPAVTVGQFGAWVAIGAEHNASGGYAVVWKNGGADQYTVWTTDSSGNYLSQTAVVSGASWYVQSLEASFNQDLNGDGRIGPVTTTVEASGSTTLAKVADSYFLYPVGGSSGPQLFFSGAYTMAGQFGAWTPIGAEHNASGGYAVVWKNGGADQYTVWTTDSSGNYLSQSAVVSGSSSTVESLEPSFNQDLNGDGTIGFHTAPIEASGNYTEAAVFTMADHSESASHLLVAGSTNVGTLGSDTTISSGLGTGTVGNVGPGGASVALLTNYIASTFATPAAEGTGAVAATQPSAQDVLTRPAA